MGLGCALDTGTDMVEADVTFPGFPETASCSGSGACSQGPEAWSTVMEILWLHLPRARLTSLPLPVLALSAAWHGHIPVCILEWHGTALGQDGTGT